MSRTINAVHFRRPRILEARANAFDILTITLDSRVIPRFNDAWRQEYREQAFPFADESNRSQQAAEVEDQNRINDPLVVVLIPDNSEVKERGALERIQQLIVPRRYSQNGVVSSPTEMAHGTSFIMQRLEERAVGHVTLLSGEGGASREAQPFRGKAFDKR